MPLQDDGRSTRIKVARLLGCLGRAGMHALFAFRTVRLDRTEGLVHGLDRQHGGECQNTDEFHDVLLHLVPFRRTDDDSPDTFAGDGVLELQHERAGVQEHGCRACERSTLVRERESHPFGAVIYAEVFHVFIVGNPCEWYNRSMAEMVKYKSTDRVFFGAGIQKQFLLNALQKTKLSQEGFANKLHVSSRTLTDWLREKYSISYKTAVVVAKMGSQKMPKILERRDQFWYAAKGALAGGKASYAKHKFGNDEANRKRAWEKWWITQGKKASPIIGKTKSFAVPKKSIDLAEFVGIMLGDGGISTYQCNITLNSVTDREYSIYLEKLIKKLFNLQAYRYKKGESLGENISINRKGVVDFLISIGLKKGNKLAQGIEIPSWILGNKEYERACVRGLIDTDGCVIHETHTIKGKKYRYARINFTSASIPLVRSVMKILEENDLDPKVRRGGTAVQLENKEKMWQYFKIIGTSNPKHLRRWQFVAGRDV
jgi:DNA-binding XRE family transcriptional regulator